MEQLKELQSNDKKSLYEKLLTDENCKFYTNFDSLVLFKKVHEVIAPLIRRRYKERKPNVTPRNFLHTPKKYDTSSRKLATEDEFLLTMMKLRLGLLTQDIADRFNISTSLCSKIFHSWLRGMADYLKHFVYMPKLETVLSTTPKRFRKFKNLIGIIDCSEIFIETPKDLAIQSATWSDYKHHNTLKFLICVAPNSSVTFISKAFTGRISDKKMTLKSEFLDLIPAHSMIMADKGFNISDECAARSIYFKVPPGKRGMSQMPPSEVASTGKIAKVRILVEQVIRRLKTFRIIANEMPVSMLSHADDILTICAAFSNFKEPIYKD